MIPKLKNHISTLTKENREAEQKRDKAELQLAPFLTEADRRYPDKPADQRFDLLFDRLKKAITDVQSAANKVSQERKLEPKLIEALVASPSTISPLEVEIQCVLGDTEGYSFATQLKDI